MKKWKVEIDQNGGEYTGWVTFYADSVQIKNYSTLDVDGREMAFDEGIVDLYELEGEQ